MTTNPKCGSNVKMEKEKLYKIIDSLNIIKYKVKK